MRVGSGQERDRRPCPASVPTAWSIWDFATQAGTALLLWSWEPGRRGNRSGNVSQKTTSRGRPTVWWLISADSFLPAKTFKENGRLAFELVWIGMWVVMYVSRTAALGQKDNAKYTEGAVCTEPQPLAAWWINNRSGKWHKYYNNSTDVLTSSRWPFPSEPGSLLIQRYLISCRECYVSLDAFEMGAEK